MTPEQDRAFLALCCDLAHNSPCAKARVGAAVVSIDGQLVGTGFNHSPNPACNDCATICAGGIRKGIKSGTHAELCYAVHAEQWAIFEAGPLAKNGTLYVASFDENWVRRLKDPTLPVGHPMRGFYCSLCARACWMAGIACIVTDSINGVIHHSPEDIWNSSFSLASASI
jgi:pyrimidine deaminase RibD-like protein